MQPLSPAALSRLSALSDVLANEGAMNLNKLLDAAAYASARRLAWSNAPAIIPAKINAELVECLADLAEADFPDQFLAPIQLDLARQGDPDYEGLLYGDAPDIYVCRTCGFLAMENPPTRCPDCGAWPGWFRKFVGLYYCDNYEPLNPMGVVSLLAANANNLNKLVNGLSEERLSLRPAQQDWSIREHIAHIYDTEEMMETRVERMLSEDNPQLQMLKPFETAENQAGRPASTHDMLAAFLEMRARFVIRLETLSLRDFYRTGWHTEFGRITILRQLAYIANHEQTHFPGIEQILNGFDPK